MSEETSLRGHQAGRAPAGRYFIETWGCQMNVLDSDKIAGSLERHGYERASSAAEADVVLLHTCSIREKAEEKVFSELGRLRPLKECRPGVVLGVSGCVAQQEGASIFERAPHVDLVIGTRATGALPVLVNRIRAGDEGARHTADTELRKDSIHFPFDQIRREPAARKAYVTVVEGCNHRCTFCIVPTTRGREVSRDMDDVLAEVRHLAAQGVAEVEFLGQTVNAYRDPRGRTLADLLIETARIPSVRRVRFTTSHPAQMTDRLMDAMASARPAVCPYLHLPVQSGSTAVLRAMHRGYDRAGYLRKIEGLKRRIPDLCFGTDIIVGFPTETETDFRETLTLLDEVGYDTVYSFTYSPRPGTPAGGWEDPVPPAEKVERLRRLQACQTEIQQARQMRCVGCETEVLVEGPSKRDPSEWTGRTPEARVVNFVGETGPGRFERVRISAATAFSLRGVLLPPTP